MVEELESYPVDMIDQDVSDQILLFRHRYKLNTMPESEFEALNDVTGNILVWIMLTHGQRDIKDQLSKS